MPEPIYFEELYQCAERHMRDGDYDRALPLLCSLLLALPIGHAAEEDVRSTLFDVFHALGRYDDAVRVL